MKRLGLVCVLAFAFGVASACGGDSEAARPAPTSRFEAVASTQGDVDQVFHDVCDVAHPPATAPTWQWPATVGPAPTRAEPGKWTWVNFWATWCHPCLEEMPLLQRTLASGPIALRFVSADANDEQLARYRSEHSFTLESPRLADPGGVPTILEQVGFRGGASLPVHVLVDPEGKVRCVRAGLVEARHLERILGALGQQAAARIR